MFEDRRDAGEKLGQALESYKTKNPLVLGIPRGGVEVAYHAARAIEADLSVIIVRKLPFPDNPESGFGAVAEDGTVYLAPEASRWVGESTVNRIVEEQKEEVSRRISSLRGGPLPSLENRQVILIDDGIAMGSTTMAAAMCCRNLNAAHILAATPAGSPRAIGKLRKTADDVLAILSPPYFRAVAEFYRNWYDVSDAEVVAILDRARDSGLLDKPAGRERGEKKEESPEHGRDIAPGGGGRMGGPCIRV